MENNPEIALAWQFIENTGTHLFLTGKAGTWKKEWMVTPPALIAAIPVGASTIIRFGLSALSFRRKVVLPVPALPVKKR